MGMHPVFQVLSNSWKKSLPSGVKGDLGRFFDGRSMHTLSGLQNRGFNLFISAIHSSKTRALRMFMWIPSLPGAVLRFELWIVTKTSGQERS